MLVCGPLLVTSCQLALALMRSEGVKDCTDVEGWGGIVGETAMHGMWQPRASMRGSLHVVLLGDCLQGGPLRHGR
jgi:hypothetical protein